jgi:GrpB-like predicted nucleotidyltransferase (UPF0157 family)
MLLARHNPTWSKEFVELREAYIGAMGPLIERVEHVGSTAVPGLMAKPILDIDIVMTSYDVFPAVVEGLRNLGYCHNGDQGIKGREAFKAADNTAPFTLVRRVWLAHHLYVCPSDGAELRRHIAFRDALRRDENLRREYECRKVSIAQRAANDRELYAQLKEIDCRQFIESILMKAASCS